MSAAQPGWQVKGVYHETCASEGHCPYYFGRDKEGGCRYFMVFRITEGQVGGVDLAGVTAVYLGDLPYATYAEVADASAPNEHSNLRVVLGTPVVKVDRNPTGSAPAEELTRSTPQKSRQGPQGCVPGRHPVQEPGHAPRGRRRPRV